MLGLFIVLPAAYLVLCRRRNELLLCFLLPVFGVSSLPSELKRYFVFDAVGVNVYPQDLLLLIGLASMVLDARMRYSASRDRTLLALVSVYLCYHVLTLYSFGSIEGFQLDYLRMTFIGALWMTFALYDFGPLAGSQSRQVGIAFTVHNVIAAIGAASLLLIPGVNDLQSPHASFVGFSADGSEAGSLILVSALSGSLAVISVWHFVFVQYKSWLSPHVVLAVLVVVATSHRIDYVALAMLAIVFLASGRWLIRSKRPVRTAVAVVFYLAVVFLALDRMGLTLRDDVAGPFIERATSLFTQGRSGTIAERLDQYQYFFDYYIRDYDINRYLFGEGYLPTDLRDAHYQWAQPHNFVLFTIVNVGMVGLVLVLLITLWVVVLRGGCRSAAFLPLFLLLLTQLTDAAFTHYPVSAYFAILISLCSANKSRLAGFALSKGFVSAARRSSGDLASINAVSKLEPPRFVGAFRPPSVQLVSPTPRLPSGKGRA